MRSGDRSYLRGLILQFQNCEHKIFLYKSWIKVCEHKKLYFVKTCVSLCCWLFSVTPITFMSALPWCLVGVLLDWSVSQTVCSLLSPPFWYFKDLLFVVLDWLVICIPTHNFLQLWLLLQFVVLMTGLLAWLFTLLIFIWAVLSQSPQIMLVLVLYFTTHE